MKQTHTNETNDRRLKLLIIKPYNIKLIFKTDRV
jgi:hypothetical protein